MTCPSRHHAGQALTEFALILALVAILSIAGLSFLRDMTAIVFITHQQSLSAPVSTATPVP